MAALDEEAALLRRPARAALLSAPEPPSAIALTVLIRTRNEADRLARTLAAAQPLGAEIVVVDAGSTDSTSPSPAPTGRGWSKIRGRDSGRSAVLARPNAA